MNAIRIRKIIDSDTLHLPELKEMLGCTVEIIILEESVVAVLPPGFVPGNGDWNTFRRAAESLRDTYDYDAQADQDACDLRDAEERLNPDFRRA